MENVFGDCASCFPLTPKRLLCHSAPKFRIWQVSQQRHIKPEILVCQPFTLPSASKEMSKECQRIIKEHGVPHLYEDACDLVHTPDLSGLSYRKRKRIIDKSHVAEKLMCVICASLCVPPCVDIDISGPPCTPWSPVGKRRGQEDEVTTVHLKWFLCLTSHVLFDLGTHCPLQSKGMSHCRKHLPMSKSNTQTCNSATICSPIGIPYCPPG